MQVEDLFYNVPSRRRAFRSASEEYAKILDMVGRYAVHCGGVAFSCKKAGDNTGSTVSVPASASIKDRIRQIHGSTAANELVNFKAEDQRWGFKCDGWVSNANYSSKRTNLLLFINHRSVESQVIKKSVEQTYATFLPKGGHPFVYLSLEIEPQRVDVNVHPTKREVHFLNEDEIVAIICDEIRESLSKVDTSRSFMTQSLLSNPKVPFATPMKQTTPVTPNTDDTPSRSVARAPSTATKRPYENNLVRTDASARKITSMLRPERTIEEAAAEGDDDMEYEYAERESMACRLTSIKELRAEVRDAMHNELTDIISTHTFVGIVDEQKRIVAIQGGVKLFLVDYGMLCNEYFYQVGLTDFANYGMLRFSPPLPIHDLLRVGADQEKNNAGDAAEEVDWDEVVDTVQDLLISKAPLLSEYFSIEITPEGELCSLPILVKGYTPSLAKLPQFLLRLGPHVVWDEEKLCFQTLLRELAAFYTPECLPLPPSSSNNESDKGKEKVTEEDPEISLRRRKLRKAIEHVIFPACKARLVATKGLLKGVMEVANLKGLYRVFERC
jgi:DNA mismatch repair protein MLH1